MINTVVLVGRLTKEPELKYTANNNSVCSFALAVDKKVKPQNGPTADFPSCVAWGKTAELLCQYMHKGNRVGVTGHLQTKSYQHPTHSDVTIFATEVVADSVTFLEAKGEAPATTASELIGPVYDISTEDLPF